VAYLVTTSGMSQRRACSMTGADRSMFRYRRRRPDDAEMRERLQILAAEFTDRSEAHGPP
jgi:putative transposase